MPCARIRVFTLAALIALACPTAKPARAAALEGDAVFTTLVVQPLAEPRPVHGADGRIHLAYELSFVNETRLLSQLDSISTIDGSSGAVLAQWKGKALEAVFRINGGDPGVTLAASHSGYAFLDVPLPAGAAIPRTLLHRIEATRLSPAPGSDGHKGVPLDPKIPLPPTVTFEGAPTQVDTRAAVMIASPLSGPGWVAFGGCCAELTPHRGSVMAFNGKATVAERFAIDFVQMDGNGRLFTGKADALASYKYYGVPVYAVADGVVAGILDGTPEGVPGQLPAGTTAENAAGNHIVLDLGGGNFALYAHLKTGSVIVRPGDRVHRGDVLARLGNTGNSDAPHLHFHVMDGPSPLQSSGLPYEIATFKGVGRLQPDAGFMEQGEKAAIDRAWFPGPHTDQMPLNNEVVDFPDNGR